MNEKISVSEAQTKIEYYCSYQERCHQEVVEKLRQLGQTSADIDTLLVHLIDQNYLNEERFARSFVRGKHRIKGWGRHRIVNELKGRHITQYVLQAALQELDPEEYETAFHRIAESHWEHLHEANMLRKRKKFCDYMVRKGWESDWVYEKVKALEQA